jgi:hypothetical protein
MQLTPTVTPGTATVVLTATEADVKNKNGTCLQMLPVIPKVPWNTFFCYRQLQLTV